MITRRSFLKIGGAAIAGGQATHLLAAETDPATAPSPAGLPRPTPAQIRWQDCEVGVLFSFDMPIAARWAKGDGDLFRDWKTSDPNLYNPEKLDTDQWIEAAKAVGAKYAIFTATHLNGFMQWQSDAYPYGLKQTRWRDGKGDVVADFMASCRKAGILPGLFFSTCHNVYWSVWEHYVDWGKGKGTSKQAAFNKVAEKMTEELCSKYGPLVQIWYDAGVKLPPDGGPDVLPIFGKHQPDSVFYNSMERSDHRWIGNEMGFADYPCWVTMPDKKGEISHNARGWQKLLAKGDPEGTVWSPGMVDVPLRGANGKHNWFWYPNQDDAVHPLDSLVRMHYQSVGRNCNFIIGEVITPDGLVPDADIKRLAELGKELRRRFGRSLAETRGRGELVELQLPQPRKVDHVIIMEDIAQGERIRKYVVEGLTPNNQWTRLCEGESVGHKRIESVEAREVARVRLRILKSTAIPLIRNLSACATA
jgi:alpha-L-fucosidase